ncbi:hypothetical protein N7460_011206 [Penicillium canescens]|uniref:NB-ARC domain-containing protein n=1 Tax=Penicillium canescens TaxID=5083 RepID=A0AAD6I192_PENCN|nr:hypothetical protein N7460_011206 [Penicillium canescens]KAJ6039677.1 hypothetical protein N7444_008582 [Penicillium canescens]
MTCSDVISGISATTTILHESIRSLDDASATSTLPKNLRTVRCRLPIIVDIIQTLLEHSESADSFCCLSLIVANCSGHAARMKRILELVFDGDDTWEKRYAEAIRTFGDITTVESLLKLIAEDIQSLIMHNPVSDDHLKQKSDLDEIIHEMRSLMAFSFQIRRGLCFGRAPYLASGHFVGRESQLDEIMRLESGRMSQKLHRLVFGGIRGVGKTQLAIAYGHRFSNYYESCFWLDASSESTMNKSFRTLASLIFQYQDIRDLHERDIMVRVHEWLSDATNTRWLLVFDGYNSLEHFDIETFYPPASHGTVIVTTRRPGLIAGQKVQVSPLENVEDRLKILQTRSGRNKSQFGSDAEVLARQLGGLPLDLVTAGLYLRSSPLFTIAKYLQAYKKRQDCQIGSRRPVKVPEYKDSSS